MNRQVFLKDFLEDGDKKIWSDWNEYVVKHFFPFVTKMQNVEQKMNGGISKKVKQKYVIYVN